MVNDERAEKALRYLASSDEQSAVLKANVARAVSEKELGKWKLIST